MKEIKPNSIPKPDFTPKPKQGLPFENIGGNWILKDPIQTPDYVQNKTGFRLDPTTLYSKIFAFGGNLTQYDAIVSQDGSGQYKTIQDAIAGGKKRIYIRSGEYLITSTIALATTKILLVGENKNDTIIKVADNADIHAITVTANNCEIRDLKIDGNKSNQSSSVDGIQVNIADECTINNCFITSCKRRGIYVSGTSEKNNIINNILDSNDDSGIYLDVGSFNNILTNNQSFSNGGYGILLVSASGNRVANNLAFSNTKSGIGVVLNVQFSINNIIVGNYCTTNTEYGIDCLIGKNIITGNSVYANTLSGMRITDAADYTVINGNMFLDNQQHGLLLNGVDYCPVTGNMFRGNGAGTDDTYSDILLNNTATYNTITGNNLIAGTGNKPKYGIREDSSADDYNIISSNVAQGAVTTNISIQGANTIKSLNQE